jgi:single-strand DNA-binding protein
VNKVFIIGNLTRDPEMRTTSTGISVCSFTVAVNRRRSSAEAGQADADFFRVSAWRQLGELCNRYLAKGRKVAVVGSITMSTFTGNDGQVRSNLEVTADEVEFLTPRSEQGGESMSAPAASSGSRDSDFVQVNDDDLPF